MIPSYIMEAMLMQLGRADRSESEPEERGKSVARPSACRIIK